MPKLDSSIYEGGREPARVKHSLLEGYLPDLVYRIGRTWDSFAYIDGFAGPWKTQDPAHADSSFAVAIGALRRTQQGLRDVHGRDVHVTCVLIEQNKDAFGELERFASTETSSNFAVHALHGEFIKTIPEIDQLVKGGAKDPFKFVLLDPTGWAQVPMEKLKSFLHGRSSEVLVTLMSGISTVFWAKKIGPKVIESSSADLACSRNYEIPQRGIELNKLCSNTHRV